ncbi:unnamed protein product [Arctia plantaginis]|uniref:Uncharacterized protein n=1 Tax=Arctia plantaginis TaxID=874455 RepID=A0A8S0ZSQ9_ARCPL|nr:unnamed protein product [Arctia plantaginis]
MDEELDMKYFRNLYRSSSDSVLTTNSVLERISSLQQQVSEQTLAPHVSTTLHRNRSSLHAAGQGALGGSMTSLSSPTPPAHSPAPSLSTSDLCERPRVSHGKPNLAPKPPAPAPDTRPSPPPKKLLTNGKIAGRTQSMRVPRSPPTSPSSPQTGGTRPFNLPPAPVNPPIGTKNPASHFGTLRAPRGMRPPGVCPPPPPGAPPPPPPPGAPPPPPPARHAQPPPPPPPHHRHPTLNGDEAPAPPVRGSSKRDLEARFADLFNPPSLFPNPDPFMRIAKGYSSATVAVSKAQAPPPPLRVPLDACTAHLVPDAHPAHALLSVAHALLCPANTLAAPVLTNLKPDPDLTVLPIDEITMPEEDVSDLQDVFDAINKLCETMRTSTYEATEAETIEEPTVIEEIEEVVEVIETVDITKIVECEEKLASPTEVDVRIVDAYRAEHWSDALSPPEEEETEQAQAAVEPVSEMYYTASSEVSLLSEGEAPEKAPVDEDAVPQEQEREDKESRKECVIAGHVAAMRERFESMTRENTPCPDLARSTSPTFDVFRNITPSPDRLG